MLFEKKVKCNTEVAESWKREEEDVEVYKLNVLLDKIQKKLADRYLLSKHTLQDWLKKLNETERSVNSRSTFTYTESSRLIPLERQISHLRDEINDMLNFIEEQQHYVGTFDSNLYASESSSFTRLSHESIGNISNYLPLFKDNIALRNTTRSTRLAMDKLPIYKDKIYMETCAGETDVIINVQAIKKASSKQTMTFQELVDFITKKESSCFSCMPCYLI